MVNHLNITRTTDDLLTIGDPRNKNNTSRTAADHWTASAPRNKNNKNNKNNKANKVATFAAQKRNSMLSFIQAEIKQMAIHAVGSKILEEGIVYSEDPVDLSNEDTRKVMQDYLTQDFKDEELFQFTHNSDLDMNEVYVYADKIFKDPSQLVDQSTYIASHLYKTSQHPKIKSGELCVVFFEEVKFEEEYLPAIGIFKSENKDTFLKVARTKTGFDVASDSGINTKKLDKGCLIIKTERARGYRVCIVDNSNKLTEAQYWKDEFLGLKPISNEYHQTNQFLNITRQYVTKQLTEDFTVSKTDQIDLLNRSVDYFKKHDNFDKEEFEKEVFHDETVIKAFRSFDQEFRQENDVAIADNFEISAQAVKKQARVFKSVLKLDKNFHIYIHGNREMIEQGIEPDGRKYYKIYFDKEA
jgi:37-kD nucleoid-associated bacterial protein